MINKLKNHKQIIGYLVAVGLSIFVLMFVISSSWIGYKVKNECVSAMKTYGGDCVEALSAQLMDDANDFGTRNTTTWALGEIGDRRALPVLESLYTGFVPPRESWDGVLSQYELEKAIKLIEGGINLTAWAWHSSMDLSNANMNEPIEETVILCDPEDEYYEVARTIAKAESFIIVENLTRATTYRPLHILWVVSPGNISEEDLWTTGQTFKAMDLYPALGIISGETAEIAEQLWQNGKLTKNGNNYLGSDIEIGQQVQEAVIVDMNQPEEEPSPLTRDTLAQTLAKSDYFYWVRHVSANKWMWNTASRDYSDNDKLYATDIPELGPVVIHTPSCGSFQPWKDDSIALGFINQGAAAYIGHVQSPIGNSFLMRKGFSVPGVTTWEEFPLGIMAQIRNKMEGKVVYSTPLNFMLGDPRAYLSDAQPYTITNDTIEGSTRKITGETNARGFLSLKIDKGAGYDFVTIPGLTSASENEFFFNNYLQTLNLGGDKYLLFYQEDDSFEIILKEKTPFMWTLWDGLIDALDYNWIAIGVVYAPISLVFLAVFAIILIIKIYRRKILPRNVLWLFSAGLLYTCLHIVYVLLRMDKFSVSADLVKFSTVEILMGIVGYFSTVCAGFMLVQGAKKRIGKIIGWIVAVFPQIILTGFKFGIITFTNIIFTTQNVVPKPLWNYNSCWISVLVLVIDLLLAVFLYQQAEKIINRQG